MEYLAALNKVAIRRTHRSYYDIGSNPQPLTPARWLVVAKSQLAVVISRYNYLFIYIQGLAMNTYNWIGTLAI